MRSIPVLANSTIDIFRKHAFDAALPRRLPPGSFKSSIPAINRWFANDETTGLTIPNEECFTQKNDFNVPVEITTPTSGDSTTNNHGLVSFQRVDMPMSQFIAITKASRSNSKYGLYVAQCPISSLPSSLQQDVPTPDVVTKSGRGDVYDSSIWIGVSPTYTPLHKDPNPNLFVQMTGRKRVRILEPSLGGAVFQEAQRRIDEGAATDARFRGEEMMQGRERQILKNLVWSDEVPHVAGNVMEADLEVGDGLFIPKGWWHSIKGLGVGINGSVNWWFR